jgi:hypothetical protein
MMINARTETAATKPAFRDPLTNHRCEETPDQKYTLTSHLWEYLQDYAKRRREKGNGFGFGVAPLDGVSRTLSARYYKDGFKILDTTGDGISSQIKGESDCRFRLDCFIAR